MDQVKFVEDNLWFASADHISNFYGLSFTNFSWFILEYFVSDATLESIGNISYYDNF